MGFTRTPSGQITKYLFYSEPLVWVEGSEDVPFYAELLRGRGCRVQSAGGKNECLRLAQAIVEHNHRYVVAIDGDYDVLTRKRSPHRRIVFLHRYSIENYLVEYGPAERVAKQLARVDPGEVVIGGEFKETLDYITSELEELLILDVAHQHVGSSEQVFPDHAEQVLPSGASSVELKFDGSRISRLSTEAQRAVPKKAVNEARKLVQVFLTERRLIDLMRGHFIFGLLRRLIFAAASQCLESCGFGFSIALRASIVR